MSAQNDFQKWCDLWDKSQEQMNADAAAQPVERKVNLNSFFGLQQAERIDSVQPEDAEHWRNVLDRSSQLFDPNYQEIITEEEDIEVIHPKKKVIKEEKWPGADQSNDGFGKDLSSGPGKNVKFQVNPIKFNSVGRDQDLRVTKNWTDGDELVELARMKSLLYSLESDFLRADCLGEKTDSIKQRLSEIQEKCHELSERLTPDVRKDVS